MLQFTKAYILNTAFLPHDAC